MEKRLELLEKLDVKLEKSMAILDVGCSIGNFVHHCVKVLNIPQTFGIDLHKSVVRGHKKHPDVSHHLIVASGEALPYPNGCFDLILFDKSFHHIPDPIKAMSEAERVVKKNGVIIFIEPIFNKDDELDFGKLAFGLGVTPFHKHDHHEHGEKGGHHEHHHHGEKKHHHHHHHHHHHEKKEEKKEGEGHHQHHHDFDGCYEMIKKGTELLHPQKEIFVEDFVELDQFVKQFKEMTGNEPCEEFMKVASEHDKKLQEKLKCENVKFRLSLRGNSLLKK